LILFSSFLAGALILTKGSEIFDKSAEPDEGDIALSIDWYEKEEKEEDKEISCLAIFNPFCGHKIIRSNRDDKNSYP
jgi:hypothetical protein